MPAKYIFDENTLTTMAGAVRAASGTDETYTLDEMAGVVSSLAAADTISVKSFGAKGDGSTDDTDAINACIEAAGTYGKNVWFPEGTYMVSASMASGLANNERYFAVRVWQQDGMNIILHPNAKIKLITSKQAEIDANKGTRYYVFGISYSKNITVTGGKVEGDKDTLKYHYLTLTDGTYGHTWGYGFYIRGCENVMVRDVEISNCYGDGICSGIPSSANAIVGQETVKTKNLVVENCHIHDCMRQGITFSGNEQCTIRNCHIHDIAGAKPQSGIDLEPDYVTNMNINTTIDGCFIHNCAGWGVVQNNGNKGTVVQNCTIYNWCSYNNGAQGQYKTIYRDSTIATITVPKKDLREEIDEIHGCTVGEVAITCGAIIKNTIFDPEYFDEAYIKYYGTKLSETVRHLLMIQKDSTVTEPVYTLDVDSCEFRFPSDRSYQSARTDENSLESFVAIRNGADCFLNVKFCNCICECESNYYGGYIFGGGQNYIVKNNLFYIKKGSTQDSGYKVSLAAENSGCVILEGNTFDFSYLTTTNDINSCFCACFCHPNSIIIINNNNHCDDSSTIRKNFYRLANDDNEGDNRTIIFTNNIAPSRTSDELLAVSSSLAEGTYNLITAGNITSDIATETTRTLSVEYSDGTTENIKVVVQQ